MVWEAQFHSPISPTQNNQDSNKGSEEVSENEITNIVNDMDRSSAYIN